MKRNKTGTLLLGVKRDLLDVKKKSAICQKSRGGRARARARARARGGERRDPRLKEPYSISKRDVVCQKRPATRNDKKPSLT
jgi:hypothetical protein